MKTVVIIIFNCISSQDLLRCWKLQKEMIRVNYSFTILTTLVLIFSLILYFIHITLF